MPWFNADSKMHAHPKMRKAGLEAMGLWIVAGTYSADLLTDGFVPDWYIETWPKGHKIATQLIVAQLWEKAEGGYRILSWNEYQRSREQVEADRAKWRERQKRARNNRRERDDG